MSLAELRRAQRDRPGARPRSGVTHAQVAAVESVLHREEARPTERRGPARRAEPGQGTGRGAYRGAAAGRRRQRARRDQAAGYFAAFFLRSAQ